MKKLLAVLLAGGLAVGTMLPGWAQPMTAAPAQAKLADCVRDIKGDSVALYFSEQYELTPVACATYCRYTRLDPQGKIYGEVRDYRQATGRLAYRQHYDHGVRQGSYEAYYPNGQLQVRGTYAQNEPSGEWQFWYADGRPQQTLRRAAGGPLPWRYVAYYDSTGQQLLTNGTGHWRELNPRQHRRVEGAVLNELPDGEWKLYALNQPDGPPLTVETYAQGVFKKGHTATKLANYTYHDQPQLSPLLPDPTAQATTYQRGYTCEELARQQAGSSADALRRRLSLMGLPATTGPAVAARPGGDDKAYLRLLVQRLTEHPAIQILLHNNSFSTTVEAAIDEQGMLHDFQSPTIQMQLAFTQVMPRLGFWHAATIGQQPASSRVVFTLNVLEQHWFVQYVVDRIRPVSP